MEKFTTILVIGLLTAGLAMLNPAFAGCLQDVVSTQSRARVDQDWVRRETVLAMLTEARRDAARGREAGCVALLEQARTQLRRPAN